MLVRLTPDQITDFWGLLEPLIEGALPPIVSDDVDRMKNILQGLLVGTMDCWVSFAADGGVRINGAVVTAIIKDDNSGTKDLLIYSVHSITNGKRDSWEEGYEALKKWAKAHECSRLTGYTGVDSIISMVRRLGGTADQTYITLPVD